ncbi:MAG: ATP-binding protein [Paracoccaceae bacterium]
MSVRLRLIIYVTALVSVLWVTAAIISRSVVIHEIDEMTSENLSVAASRFMPLVLREVEGHDGRDDDSDSEGPRELDEELRFLTATQDGVLSFEVRDRDGNVRLRSFDADRYDFPDMTKAGFEDENDLTTYTMTDRQSGLSLIVGEPDSHRDEAIAEATLALFTPLLLMLPLTALAILYLSRQIVEPLHRLSLQVSARGGTNFDRLDIANQPSELRPIADAIDRLLERLRAAMDAERAFSASSAHELRTPIAGALAQVQRLKNELVDGPGRDRALEIEATMKRLADFTDKLLQLSRVDAEPGVHKIRENMRPVLDLVIKDFAERAENAAEIKIEDRLNQDLIVAMDPDALAICLRNLFENAILHGDGETPIEVVIESDWSIHVISSGPAVASDRLSELTERFARGDTPASGSGLGLSIVDRIMKQSGGALILRSPALGRRDGFEAVLQLP